VFPTVRIGFSSSRSFLVSHSSSFNIPSSVSLALQLELRDDLSSRSLLGNDRFYPSSFAIQYFFYRKKISLVIKKGAVLYEEVDEVYAMYLCD
jgi:hypothetical protein